MRFSKAFICGVLLFLVVAVLPARATMLIIIYTPDGYWIGADSARQFENSRVATVCKVHKTKWGLVLKGGIATGTTDAGGLYSTDAELEKLIGQSQSVEDFKQRVRSQYLRDVNGELAYIMNKNRQVSAETIESTNFNRSLTPEIIQATLRMILLVPEDSLAHPASTLTVEAQSRPEPYPKYGSFRFGASIPVDWRQVLSLPHGVRMGGQMLYFPESVQIFSAPVGYSRDNAWVIAHPEQAIREMLNIGHSQNPVGIGPPYVILHVSNTSDHKTVYHWISKGKCESWTSDVTPHSYLDRFR